MAGRSPGHPRFDGGAKMAGTTPGHAEKSPVGRRILNYENHPLRSGGGFFDCALGRYAEMPGLRRTDLEIRSQVHALRYRLYLVSVSGLKQHNPRLDHCARFRGSSVCSGHPIDVDPGEFETMEHLRGNKHKRRDAEHAFA
jgi:hypothetical protein